MYFFIFERSEVLAYGMLTDEVFHSAANVSMGCFFTERVQDTATFTKAGIKFFGSIVWTKHGKILFSTLNECRSHFSSHINSSLAEIKILLSFAAHCVVFLCSNLSVFVLRFGCFPSSDHVHNQFDLNMMIAFLRRGNYMAMMLRHSPPLHTTLAAQSFSGAIAKDITPRELRTR